MNKRVEQFLKDKTLELIKNGFGVKIHSTKLVHDPDCGISSGFFCADRTKELQVAIGRPQREWVPIFVHEYCHFLQWQEDSKEWRDNNRAYEVCGNLWSWLAGHEEITKTNLQKLKVSCQALEQDCDKRAVKLIQEEELPIDIEDYIQTSNAYILFYNICVEERCWYGKSPYSDNRIKDMMPAKFLPKSKWGRVPRKYRSLIIQEFIDK